MTVERGLSRFARKYADHLGRERPGDEPARDAILARVVCDAAVQPARRSRFLFASATLAASACLTLWLLWPSVRQDVVEPRALTYTQHGGVHLEDTLVARASEATLTFTDGTLVALAPGSTGSVRQTTPHGAALVLHEGRLAARVRHAPAAAWTVNAGPFMVKVTGTTFDVDWSGKQRALSVGLHAGSVIVTGPLTNDGIRVVAGQRLTIDLNSGRVELHSLVDPPAASETTSAPRSIAPPRHPPRAHRAKVSSTPRTPTAEIKQLDWAQAVSRGDYGAVVADAERTGLAGCLSSCGQQALLALGNAARFTRKWPVARLALFALRQRFGTAPEARDATFLLGVIATDTGQDTEAAGLFGQYLNESPDGPYAEQALGRQLVLARRQGSAPPKVVELARTYLQRHPKGTYAELAREILAER